MGDIVAMIEETDRWRLYHRSRGGDCRIEAAACAIREHALLDALREMGGDTARWRKPSGVLRDYPHTTPRKGET